jgi:hypothetical protein
MGDEVMKGVEPALFKPFKGGQGNEMINVESLTKFGRDHLAQQEDDLLFAGKVVIDDAGAAIRLFSNVSNAQTGQAMLRNELQGCLQNFVASSHNNSCKLNVHSILIALFYLSSHKHDDDHD